MGFSLTFSLLLWELFVPQLSKHQRFHSDLIMSLFLPKNVEPLAPAANLDSWNDQMHSENPLANAEFFMKPTGMEKRSVSLDYHQL